MAAGLKRAEAEEKAQNRYLVGLAKQQAAREAAEAKEVAVAQAKADKLAAIQEKQAAKAQQSIADQEAAAAKRQSQIGPTIVAATPADEQTNATGAAFSEAGLTDQQAKIEAIAAAQTQSTAATASGTAAIQAETVALTEQEAALNSIVGTFEQNSRLQVAMAIELSAVQAEMKGLNVETAAGVAAKERLTQEELRLKAAMVQNNTVLTFQAKEQISTAGSADQLNARLGALRAGINSLSDAERASLPSAQVLKAEIAKLEAQTKALDAEQGIYNKNVGNYPQNQGKFAAAISRVTDLQTIGARVVTQFSRQIIGLGVAFLSFEIGAKAIKSLIDYIGQLNIFNPIASEAAMKAKAFEDAFASADYSKAIEGVESLQANLDLAKKGFIDSDVVINQYNDTIGKTTGFVDNLNDAQQGFINNSADFIRAATLEAAAQILLADSAKFAAETAVKNQKLQEDIDKLNESKATVTRNSKGNPNAYGGDPRAVINVANKDIQSDRDAIKENLDREQQYYNNSLKGIKSFYAERAEIQKKYGVKGGSDNTANDAIATLRNQIDNSPLERQKILSQNLINDDKQSYGTRIKAVNDFYAASKGIADNNEKLATNGIKLSNNQKLKIEGDYSNQLLQLQQTRDVQIASLRDKQYKQDQEHFKKPNPGAKGYFPRYS